MICINEIECTEYPCGKPGPYIAQACGDADANGTLTARDALIALRTAIGTDTCALTICDAARDGDVTAGDALRLLAAAVGLDVVLACPAPCTNTPQ